jgi:OmpA-OmpF porin, OOP family
MKRVLVGLLMLAPAAALAGDEAGHWYLSPYIGGISPDKTRAGSTNSQLLYGIDVGHNLSAAAAPPPPPPAPSPPPPAPPPADVILEGVTFATNSAVLTEASKPILDDAAKGLHQHPDLVVEVQGHTDSTGSPGYNLELSQRRAEAVREYLISQGVSASQLTAKGYGQTEPIASNSTAAARAQNRRVVLHVLRNPGDVVVHKEGQT